jgi:hypothetical protein
MAFQDLKAQDVLLNYERKDIPGPRKKLLDVVFKIWPSLTFVREVKAANKRLADGQKQKPLDSWIGDRKQEYFNICAAVRRRVT